MNEELKGIMLEDSWVLSWATRDDSLFIEVEFSLWPEHPQYQQPKTDEWTCYLKGNLIFEGISLMHGLRDLHDVTPTITPDGEKDYGNIDSLEEVASGEFAISGDFGDVHINCRNLKIEIEA